MVNRIDTIDGKLKLDFPHFAREHMELLDAVEQYGYGNWGDIAKKVSCSRAGGGGTDQVGESNETLRVPPEVRRLSSYQERVEPRSNETWLRERNKID